MSPEAAVPGGIEEDAAPAPEPTAIPPGWVAPTSPVPLPVETETEEEVPTFHRKRRFWIVTAIYALVFLVGAVTVNTDGQPWFLLVPLVPLWALTLPFVLRRPKRLRQKARPGDSLGLHYRLMITVAVFLALYVPFTFFSNEIIPLAPLVEYVLFALLIFVLLRIGGRALGIAPSVNALPPPTHRLHRQVVAQIDDLHYQQNLYLNYNFVEKGRGAHQLAKRLDAILEENGVPDERRRQVLAPLESQGDAPPLWFGRRARNRVEAHREERARLLDDLFTQLNRELETIA